MDEFPCVLMEEMWCWQAELRNWDRFFVGQFLVVKRNGNIPTLVGMNEFSASCAAKDLRKIPFHYSCSLCHGHCRYHLIPAIHSRKDPFNPTMTMWFRSDRNKNPGIYNDSSMWDASIKVLVTKGPQGFWSYTCWCIHVMINSKVRLLSQKSWRFLTVLRNLQSLQYYKSSIKTMPLLDLFPAI